MEASLIRKYSIRLLFVLAIVILCGCQESNPQIDQNLIDQIEIKTFIVSRDQLADIFRTDEDPIQFTNGKLMERENGYLENYLVMKIKNNSDQSISGRLRLFPYGHATGIPFTFDHLKPHMNSFAIYISFTNSGFMTSYRNDMPGFGDLPPQVKINWEKLYVE